MKETAEGRAAGAVAAAPSPYGDAELYDLVLGGYRDDLDFWLSAARSARGAALEIGCGTGRVLLHCLQAGVDMDGLDLHPSMLERLKRKAAELGLKPRVLLGDMRDFTMPRRYALVLIPCNGFVHNLTTGDQLKTLRVCREHLEPGGALVLHTFNPSFAEMARPDGERVLELEAPHPVTGLPIRLYDTRRKDRVNQLQFSVNEVEELDAQGNVLRVRRNETTMRWVYQAEMELLLEVAGFARWRIAGDFDGRPLGRDDNAMVVTAWRE